MKGELMQENNKRKKMTLLLDSETITTLKNIGFKELGQTNVSKTVMFIAKEYAKLQDTKS